MPPTSPKKLSLKTEYPIIHFLIGLPGSGKSTFAKLISTTVNCEIISTDDIRTKLYGNAAIQGDWQKIETEAITRIIAALTTGKSVIYDATNFKRAFRIDFIQKIACQIKTKDNPYHCIAWHLHTPLSTCIAWNQQRSRQVPQAVIESMHAVLKDFPPITGEGFVQVESVNPTSNHLSSAQIAQKITNVQRSITNSQNRNGKQRPVTMSQTI